MRVLLLFPPLTDPTLPPLGVATLHAVLARAAHEVTTIDLNVELVDALLEESRVRAAYDAWRTAPGGRSTREVLTYRRLPELVDGAKHDLRHADRFFSAPAYRQATNVVRLAMRLYSDAMGGIRISDELNGFGAPGEGPTSLGDFKREHERFVTLPFNPVRDWLDARVRAALALHEPEVVGIAQVYDAQAPLTRYLARRVREWRPGAHVVLGGTSLSEHVARLQRRDRDTVAAVFGSADYLVVGEGEPALPALLDSLACHTAVASVPNLAYFPPDAPDLVLTAREYVTDLDTLPPPHFTPETLALYLSPEPVLPVAPTRGCYWDRCAFCAYGLREEHRATAPYREMSPAGVVRHLAAVQADTGARHVIFAVDVLSGPCAAAYAQAIREAGLNLRWQAEMRPEPALLHRNRLATLAAGGLRHLSLGMESASQVVLDAMGKGTQVKHFGSILREMDAQGIAVDLMLFRGFPSEGPAELLESLQFLLAHQRYIHRPVRLGQFHLIAGCGVAKAPARFGVRVSMQRRDTVLSPDVFDWTAEPREGIPPTGDDRKEGELATRAAAALRRLTGNSHVGARPWVGATGSAHTFLWFAINGIDSVRQYNDFIANVRLAIGDRLPWFGEGAADASQGAVDAPNGAL